ncbi:SDR family oxidoreductase [Piscinibacter sp. HJYY11]|uniref:SDR family oxidoreductase n=1 Tax=Piscinibacter sp. HJYY11 TaxID=2801333 RepID=UPI00191FEFEC|nr:SDR family oxidoreductase [Piscinibacter sp. HJYY11]MBL0728326.1 SDR family oxidoreductase [Piscinibacter sp. HJYY11]
MNVLIIGASRGIGLEFVRQYRADKAQVTATARSDEGLQALRELGSTALQLDVASTESASRLGWQIEGAAFDVAIVVAGVYGPRTHGLQPPTEADFDAVMHTNVLGPMRVIPQIADALAPNAKLAVLSSRMGSIGSRSSASGWLYRASKAAVNSVLKDASIVLQGKATCVSFHPGWVRTDMGGAGADLEVDASVRHMRRVLAGLTPADNGRFFDHDGTPIAW